MRLSGSSGRVSAGCLTVMGFGVVAAGLLLLTRSSEPLGLAPLAPLHFHELFQPAAWSRTGASAAVEEYAGLYDGDLVRLPSVPVAINSMGLRDREYPFLKAPGVWRLLALGDELTFGHGIVEADVWPRRLQAALALRAPAGREIEVLNAGQVGASLENEVEMLEARWLGYRPDRILLAVNADDGEDRRVRLELERGRLAELATGSAGPTPEQRLEARRWAGEEAARLLAAEDFAAVWERCEQALAALDRLARLEGVQVTVIFLDGSRSLAERLADEARRRQWDHVDLGGIMRTARARGETLHFQDPRPNASVQAEIARRLAEELGPRIPAIEPAGELSVPPQAADSNGDGIAVRGKARGSQRRGAYRRNT